jgi:riboflavin-specific deaminase-like protein
MTTAEYTFDSIRQSCGNRPYVIAQLGQSLDGRIALPSGESKYINGPEGLDHLHGLRAAVDAVVVGIGTVLTDDPQLTVRRVPGKNPARVVIDPNARLTGPRRILDDNGAPVILLRREGCRAPVPSPARAIYLEAAASGFRCEAIVDALAAEGFHRMLVEGGATTVSRFFEEGQLDRLHLLVGPVFLGDGKQGLTMAAPKQLASAVRVAPAIYRLGGGEILFDCALRSAA